MNGRFFRIIATWLASLLFLISLGNAWAHGEPKITVTPEVVAPGGNLEVRGESLTENGEITISLQGALFVTTLGTATGDAEGDFIINFIIPPETPGGTYLVRALGADGKTASAQITVTEPPPTPTPEAAATVSVSATPEAEAHPEPSAAEHQIPRSRSTGEWALILLGLGLSAGVGLFLVRTRD
ncbi:MAG: hypothetical protein HYZ68_03220 [Chloroflexi bacterium]|nr:hypothetical protein [Chloroflexota bacterium]